MRLITNEEVMVVAGGDDALPQVVVTGKKPIDSTPSGGLTGGGTLNMGPKLELAPDMTQKPIGNETTWDDLQKNPCGKGQKLVVDSFEMNATEGPFSLKVEDGKWGFSIGKSVTKNVKGKCVNE